MLKFSILIFLINQLSEQDTIKKIVEETKFEKLQEQIRSIERKISNLDAYTGKRLAAIEKNYSKKQINTEENAQKTEKIKQTILKLENENLAQKKQFNNIITKQRRIFYYFYIRWINSGRN